MKLYWQKNVYQPLQWPQLDASTDWEGGLGGEGSMSRGGGLCPDEGSLSGGSLSRGYPYPPCGQIDTQI